MEKKYQKNNPVSLSAVEDLYCQKFAILSKGRGAQPDLNFY